MPQDGKTGLYYSISCEQGALDLEELYGLTVPSVVEELLGLEQAGAVGMVAFSRWGWVASSYKLMASFYEHLFSDAAGNAAQAMYLSFLDYPYYRDQIYGQGFYGDPSLVVYTGQPAAVAITVPEAFIPGQPLTGSITAADQPLPGVSVTAFADTVCLASVITDADGKFELSLPDQCPGEIKLTAFKPGLMAAQESLPVSIVADAGDDGPVLPLTLELAQNFPNPFNPSTTINLTLPRAGRATLKIYNVVGQLVETVADAYYEAGEHEVIWSGRDAQGNDAATGIYLYQLDCEGGGQTKKMCLIR